ncbi:PTS sugar transporter subunit IIA [Lactobacillus sp. ESL0731]|uniref:PTS sugar transporter subunit IIA n=1 Tax=unclassified Lactobacillus TaxID=2620435 RepID=UPI0023F769FA|nr:MULTISPECIES: PTS sugar transporter subunit IIA [unclassified Lactobacillus]WEV51568.1 PTS sugar transporter subunit IIA [Lactobacillus sp. ESL0700]WEV62696.1 PTS sugar transporter subunit IIA [Lactobacillus sp. ESL0731]
MNFSEYVDEKTIYLGLDVANVQELFQFVANDLEKHNFVLPGFFDYLVSRENNYPTGLKLNNYAVAIPHGDPKYIQKPFVAVITLNHPIKVRQMDDANAELDVKLLFLLGMNANSAHLDLLKEIISLIQQESFVKKISAAKTKSEVVKVIRQEETK